MAYYEIDEQNNIIISHKKSRTLRYKSININYMNGSIDINLISWSNIIIDEHSSFCGLGYQGKENPTIVLQLMASCLAYQHQEEHFREKS